MPPLNKETQSLAAAKEDAKPLNAVEDGTEVAPQALSGFSFVKKKLFTKEDKFMVHKFFGFLAICSFLYRYGWVYNRTGTLGFDGTRGDWLTMAVHVALSTSSFVFHVLKRRILRKPAIIWEEYRLHAIVFTLRCLSVVLMGHFGIRHRGVLLVGVLTWHVLADLVTKYYGVEGQSTVRGIKEKQHKPAITALTRVYAFYQLSAVASHISPHTRAADLGYNTLIAIQSSAFLMTLYRKSLIPWYFHAIGYTLCLVLSGFHIYRMFFSLHFLVGVLVVFTLRVYFRMDKYVLWLGFSVAFAYLDGTLNLASGMQLW